MLHCKKCSIKILYETLMVVLLFAAYTANKQSKLIEKI